MQYKNTKNKKDGNLYIVFSCEPTKATPAKGVTMALIDRLKKFMNDNNGDLVLPDALKNFQHNGAEKIDKVAGSIRLTNELPG